MDDQTDDSNFSRNEDAVCPPLSPIIEMDESTVLESSEALGEDVCLEGDLKHSNLVEPKLNLETTLENTEERLSDPTTPPEVLRLRLDYLQNEYEELKEFTELERQMYHSDCVSREKVRSWEEGYASLFEKVNQLMTENLNYKNKMKEEEIEKIKLERELAKALYIQSGSITLVELMKEKIKSNVKGGSTISENQSTFSFLENCGENEEEVSNIQNVDGFLNSLRDLDILLKIIICDKKELQDKVDNLQLKASELNHVTSLQELENINKEPAGKSVEFSISENNPIVAETTTNIVNNEKDKLQDKVISIISALKNIIDSFKDDSDISCFLTHEHLTILENDFANYRDLSEISNILAVLEHIFHRLKNELKLKNKECYELQLNFDRLNDHLRSLMEDRINEHKLEIEILKNQVCNQIPSRISKMEHCLISKENENLILKNNLEQANKNIDELSNELSETKNKLDKIKVSLDTKSLEKISLENELLELKNCMTLDDAQTSIIFIIKYLEELIDSWDEKSNIRDIVNVLQENKDILNIFNLLMNAETQTMFSKVVMKWKVKLLLHGEENNKLHTTLQNIKTDIDNSESKNKELRLELNKINQIVREEISKRVSDLEKLSRCTDNEKCIPESKSCLLYGERHDYTQITPDEEKSWSVGLVGGEPQALNNGCEKLQKEINNFNKAIKSDDGVIKKNYDLSEVETLIDSWDCSMKIQSSEFTKHLDEKLTKCYDSYQNSKLKVDIFRIINKFKLKVMEIIDLNNQLQQTVQSLHICVKDYENKHKINNKTIKDLKCETDVLKEKNFSEKKNCEKKYECDRTEEVETVKKLLILEITSLDETEDKDVLMADSLEGLFCKLMQIIMKKEQEMSYIIQKQQKEEFHNFEQTIEKLNKKLKSQESWTKTLESENEKINTEYTCLNNSFEHKLKSLSNELNNKTLEIDSLKNNISILTAKNESLISKLDKAEEIINNYKQSNSLMEKDILKLNDEIVNKTNIIKHLELKWTSDFDKQEVLKNIPNIQSLNSLTHNGKGDSTIVGANQIINEGHSVNMVLEDCPNIMIKDSSKKISGFGTGLSEVLRKEIDFIKDMIRKGETDVDLSEFFSTCHDKLDLLKDVILTIGSKVSDLDIIHVNDLQTMQSTLEYKNKELHDLQLSVSKLYRDFSLDEVETRKGEVFGHSFEQFSVSLKNELDQMKSECINFTNTSEELEQSAKMGQNIIQNLREIFQIVIEENSNMAKLIDELRKCIEYEEEKTDQEKQKADRITKENKIFVEKNSLLENEVKNLKLELCHIKREMFSEIDIIFPDKMQSNEKCLYINNILKQYSEYQKVYSVVTDDLRYFGYQCELMLSYIGSLEYKLYFAAQQQENLVKENASLKGQLSSQNIEMNRFINQLISKSPFPISTLNQALEVIGNIFSEYKFLKENEIEHVNENKRKQEKIFQQQKELTSLTKDNSSLKYELMKCEESIRKLRSEKRTIHSHYQRKENIGSGYKEVKQNKIDVIVQTEGTCCEKLQKKLIEQKEKIDILSAKLTKNEQLLQQSNLTSSPFNKQISHLEGALGQAKERIRQLHFALKQQESYSHELEERIKSDK